MTGEVPESWNLLWRFKFEILALSTALVAGEAGWLWRRRLRGWTWRESLANLATLVGTQVLRGLTLPVRLVGFELAAALAPWQVPLTPAWAVAGYVLLDLLYYAKHRWLHATSWGWAMHSVHHSSPELNLTTAVRSSWLQRIVDDFFYLPLALVGFHPVLVLILAELNLYSQLWVHTRVLPRLGWLEGWLNTPAAHRVHHAVDRRRADANYGSTFSIWDRLFGTWIAGGDGDETRYGIAEGDPGSNPLSIQVAGLQRYFLDPGADARRAARTSSR